MNLLAEPQATSISVSIPSLGVDRDDAAQERERRVARLRERVRDLPPLPQAALDAMSALRDEDCEQSRVAELLGRDPALASRVLRLANSAFYGAPGRVARLADAALLLGRRTLLSLVTLAAVGDRFEATRSLRFSALGFWRHATATAIASAAIARQLDLDDGAAFVAGLLHDIGRLAMATYEPDAVDAALERVAATDERIGSLECRFVGIGHDALGAAVAASWRFPTAVVEAIARHHVPTPGPDRGPSLADVVHAADALVHALDLAGDPDDAVPELDPRSWARIELSPRAWLQVFHETEAGAASLAAAIDA